MKFSYKLLKQLVPQIKSQNELVDKLTMHAFEIDSVKGDTIDIKLPPNRYSDAGSHIGIARDISAILGRKFRGLTRIKTRINADKREAQFRVEIKDKNLCPRYSAQYFENIKIGPSPKWMQDVLKTCGLRPINNVVDIMNYAMLETGQPLHAFDFDKLTTTNRQLTTILVRMAVKGEKITTLDDQEYKLDKDILVIADSKKPLAIAGIKGGKVAEVNKNTKRIIVESANFDATNVYKTSKHLSLSTDASIRFSRNLSPELAIFGLNRAGQLLEKIAGARAGQTIDAYPKKQPKKIIKFSVERFNNFIGTNLDFKTIKKYLENLGFTIKVTADQLTNSPISQFLVEVPPLRTDIEFFEDVAEEVARLYGYNKLKSVPPTTHLKPSGFEDQIVLKDKIRKILASFGLIEVYNYSFISEKDGRTGWGINEKNLVELENPISSQFQYLRPSFYTNLLKNISDNSRFFDRVAIFEIGKVFYQTRNIEEKLLLGLAISSKEKETFFELKGIISKLFKKIGLTSFSFAEPEENVLTVKSGNEFLGEIKKVYDAPKHHISLAQIDLEQLLKLAEGEYEFKPLPKYPSVMRDLSIAVSDLQKVGEIMQEIQLANRQYIEDVDLIDEYELTRNDAELNAELRGKTISYTFRIVFQASDKTLTDAYVDSQMDKINSILKNKFKATIR